VNSMDSEKIECEYWDTPVFQSNELWLERQVYTENQVVFFFKRNHDSPEGEYHVLSINGHSPFRMTEEGLGWKVVGDLLKNDISPKDKQTQKGRTFKVWNTQFAIESCLGLAIPAEEFDKMAKFQYIIYTNDVWIQFVTFKAMKWEFYQGIKLDDLVMDYLRKDPSNE
jgi:hypothetical protein